MVVTGTLALLLAPLLWLRGVVALPSFMEAPGAPPSAEVTSLLKWSETVGVALNKHLALRQHPSEEVGHALFATGPIEAGEVLVEVPLGRAVHRQSLEMTFVADTNSPISRFVLRRSRAHLQQRVGAYGEVFGLAWWLVAADHNAVDDDVNILPTWTQYVRSLPEEFATALSYEDAELQALEGSSAYPLARDMRDAFDAEYRAAQRGWERCSELGLSEFDSCSTPWPFVLEEFAWAASMVLTRSFLISVPDSDGSRTELESSLMLLPVGDLFNHGAQTLSRTRYDAERESITIVTKTAFQEGDEVTINYGNHSVSDFLVRYGFVPKGQVRSVNMEVVPWPLRGISTQPSLGQVASQPHTDMERELHRKLLEHRHHDPGYGFVRLFQNGLDSQSNFVLRLMHLRQGSELSGYAISHIWDGQRPFSIHNEAAMIIHLWATCETALSKFPGTDFSNVGTDIELLQGGSLAQDPLMYQLVRYRLGEKFVIASCIESMRPAAMALLERGMEGAMFE